MVEKQVWKIFIVNKLISFGKYWEVGILLKIVINWIVLNFLVVLQEFWWFLGYPIYRKNAVEIAADLYNLEFF